MHQESLTQHKFTEKLLFPVRATPNLNVCLKRVNKGRKHIQYQLVSTQSASDTNTIILTSSVYKFTISFSLYKCVKLASLKYKKSHFSKDFCISPCESQSHGILTNILYWCLPVSVICRLC